MRKQLDIRPGDSIVPDSPFTVMANPNLLLAKAWDNRIGCALAAETARGSRARRTPTRCSRWRRCRKRSACAAPRRRRSRCSPTSAFALDVGIAHDTPGTEGDEKLGGGPLVVVYDASAIPNRALARSGHRHRTASSSCRSSSSPWSAAAPTPAASTSPRRACRASSIGVAGALHPQPRQHHRPPRLRRHREAARCAREAARQEDRRTAWSEPERPVPLRIYDTLTREKREFAPVADGRVGMYVCGMTVQDQPARRPHPRVARRRPHAPLPAAPRLRRRLRLQLHRRRRPRSSTRANQEGIEYQSVSERNIEAYLRYADLHNITRATHYPRATAAHRRDPRADRER